LGEQNDLVLSELLGMDDSTIQQLRSTGVISQ